jgi:UPF0755 protein
MKKFILAIFILLLIGTIVVWYLFLGSATTFNDKTYTLFIKTGSNYENVLETLKKDNVIGKTGAFNWLAGKMGYKAKVKPGRYIIKKDVGVYELLKMLRSGNQEPVNLTIAKIRLPQNLAALVGKKLECDSATFLQFLSNTDSLKKYGLDSFTVLTAVIPNTYSFYWSSSPSKIFARLVAESNNFWTVERVQKAKERKLTPKSAYTLASIVEEETNANIEKDTIASVYLNRMWQGMPLGADPTVKFALKDFSLKRILNIHTQISSAYNTYRVQGLPPGPICTPSSTTIDKVINAPKTDYLYFVASSDFNGRHQFTTNYNDHLKLAHQYHDALDKYLKDKNTVIDNSQQ